MECASKYMASENTCKEHHTRVLQYATKITEDCTGLLKVLDIFRKRIGKISLPAKYWKSIIISGVHSCHKGNTEVKSFQNTISPLSDVKLEN